MMDNVAIKHQLKSERILPGTCYVSAQRKKARQVPHTFHLIQPFEIEHFSMIFSWIGFVLIALSQSQAAFIRPIVIGNHSSE